MDASLRPRRVLALLLVVLIAPPRLSSQTAPATQQPAPAEDASKDDPDRKRAVDLLMAGKMVEAMPVFEDLCNRHPNDGGLWEGWGVSTLGYSQTLKDSDLRKKSRLRARSFLLKARELGDNSNLVQSLLPMISEDGSDVTFSSQKDVDQIMQRAEADFARGNYDRAREGYLQAVLLEPKNYSAALFIGDVYFKQNMYGSAGEWFAHAIDIDPNQETAYRYWGDALWSMGKSADAREKYIQAIIADPYNNRTWMGLTQWAQRTKVNLNWVKLQDKSSITQTGEKNINITLDAGSFKKNDPSGSAWLVYGMNRALWHGDKFKKEFPNESTYRRTLREETECLHLMVSTMTAGKDFAKKKKELDPALLELVQIDQSGFLEPFALLNRADKEIAQDYSAYRDAHRETIYRYFNEYVVPKAPSP